MEEDEFIGRREIVSYSTFDYFSIMPPITAVSQEDERERVVHFMQDQTLYKFQKKSKEWAGMTMTEMLQILSSLVKRNHVGKSKIYHYLLKFSDQSTFILPTVDDNDYREMLTKLLKESQVSVEVLVEVNFVLVESNSNFKSSYIILKKTNEWMEMEINDYFKLLHDFVNEKDNNLFIAKYSSLKIEFEDKTTFILYNRHLKAIFENEITIDFKEIKNKLLEEGKATVYIFNNIGITDDELKQSKKYEMSFHYYSNKQERNQFTMSLLDIINLNEAQFFQNFIVSTDLTDNDVLECYFSVGAGDSTLNFKTIVCSDTDINFNNECILIVKCMLKWIVAKSKTSTIAKINCNYYISERYLNRGKYKIVQSIKGNKYTEEVMIVSKYFSKNKKLILKKIDKDYIIEYDILMELNNPYIIKPLDMFKKKDFVYFTMPYFDLGDLKQFFENYYDTMVQDNTLTKIIIQIIEQVAKGLHYMHHEKHDSQKHILHGDIKEQNVFVTEFDGETIKIVLGDFGFTHLSSNSRNSSLSDRGTLEYLSPEIIRQQSYGYKTDIWSFGIMIYYLLTYEPKDKNNFDSKISIGKDLINSYESTKKIINEIKQKYFGEHEQIFIDLLFKMLVIDLNERCQAKDIISDLNNMSNYDHQTTIKIEEDRETLDSEIVNGIIMNDMIDEENNRNELETFYQEEYKEDLKEDLIIKRISEENLEDLEQEYIYEEFQTTTHLKNKLNNEQQIGKFKFIDLSDEIIMIIIEFLIGNNNNNNNLKYLISFKNFYHLSISCKRLYEISNNDEIWKNILQNRLFLYRFFDTTRKYKIILEPSDKKEFIYLYKKQENYKKYKNYKKEYELNYDIVRFIGILSLMFLFSIIPTLLFGLLLDEIIIPTFINYMLVWLSSLPLIIIVIAILNNFKYFPLLTFIYLIYSKYLNFRKKIKEKKLKILKENPNLVTMKDFIFETNYIKLTLKGYLYFNNNIFYNLIYSPFITCILFFIFIGFIFINFYENFSLTYFLAIPLIIYLTYFNINTFILSKNIEDKSLYRFIIFFLLTIPTILFITQLLITCLMMDHKIWLNNRVWSLSFIPIYIFIMYPFILIIITCVAAKKNYLFRFSGDSLDYFGMTLIVYIIFFSIPLTVMFILIGLKLDNILPSTILFSYLFIIPTAILFICGFILAFIAFLFKRDEYFTGKMFRGLNKHFKEFSIYSNNNNNNSNSHSLFVHTKTLPIHIPLVRNDDDDDNDVLIREFWRFNY